MPTQSLSLFFKSVNDLLRTWPRLLATALIYQIIAFVVLTPLAGLTLKFLMMTRGSSVVADVDILFFVLSPAGMAALVLMGSLGLAILALEQACLMAIGFGQTRNQHISTIDALRYGARHAWKVVLMALRIFVRTLLIALPFLAAGGLVYLLLLRKYDINFYLSQRPTVFYVAAGAIGVLLAVMAILIIRRLLSWAMALPLLLFEGFSPAGSLTASTERTAGHKKTVGVTLVTWGAAAALLSSLPLAVAGAVGSWMVPRVSGTMAVLVVAVGAVLLLWGLLTLIAMLVNAAMLALLTVRLYDTLGSTPEAQLSISAPSGKTAAGNTWRLTPMRMVTALALTTALAALAGYLLVDSETFNDDVIVIAHRGAAGDAPENTLAAVELALEQGTDMVEIDVQESADGEVVVIHDSDLKRVGGSPLKIWEATLWEMQQVDIGGWFGPQFNGQRLPTLEQVLELCKDRAMVDIELKYYGHNDRLEERVAEIVERTGMEDQIVLMSLVNDLVQSMKALRPRWAVGLLTAKVVGDLTTRDADFLAVHIGIASPRFVRRAHAAGKEVYVWTVNDRLNMSRMISRGVDGLITDYPALARQVIEERAEMNPAERLMLTAAFWLGLDPKEPPPERDAG